MKFPTTIKRLIDGNWQARTIGTTVGNLQVLGDTREEALDKLRGEIRYRMEWCPCSSVGDAFVELEVTEAEPSRWRGTVF